jgi:hypothetical protein
MSASERRKPPIWTWPTIIVGLLLVYVFVVQSSYVTHEKAEGEVCEEWQAEGRDVPSECSEGILGSLRDIVVGDASTNP